MDNLTINTRLDAINYVLSCIGLAPVESEDEYNLDVAQAAGFINNYSRRIQDNGGQGWWFNRELNWMMAPDPVNGSVQIPNNALATFYVNKNGQQVRIATRGRALYDVKQHRFDMRPLADSNGYMNLTLVTQVDFDDLPYTVKNAVATAAGAKFATSNEMDINRIKVLAADAEVAIDEVRQENTSQQKNNAFKDNKAMLQFDIVAGGYNNWQGV